MSPKEIFLAHLGLIERLVEWHCRRCHFQREEAEDVASVVKLKLIDDDYRVLRQFQSKSRIETYLTVVVRRLFLDYLNHLWGKRRSSAAALRLGEVGCWLERLLGEGHTLDEACEILRTNHGVGMSRAELEEIAAEIPPRAQRRFEGEEQLANVQAPDGSPEQRIRERELGEVRDRAIAAMKRALAELSDEDRLIIEMRARGAQIPQIARALGREDKPLYTHIQRILKTLREAMEKEGVHGDDIRAVLREE